VNRPTPDQGRTRLHSTPTGKSLHAGKVVMLFAITLLLTACTGKSKAPESLVFADPDQPMVGLVYIAEMLGYFRDENLTLTYRKFTSGRDAINSVLAGEADVGVATEFPLAKNILDGKDLQIIGTLYRTSKNAALVGRRDRGISQIADLKGKRIGVAPNTNTDYMLSLMLAEASLADNDVQRVAFKPEQMADALAEGKVDAVVTWSPFVGHSEARFARDATVRLQSTGYTELSLLGARPQVLVQKADAFQRLMNALVRAEDYVAAHDAESLQLLSKHLGHKQETDLQRAWPALKFKVRLDNLMLAALTDEAAWLAAHSTPAAAAPDFLRRINVRFLEASRPQAVTLKPDKGD
jgi:ABC-type nitrate/sulfonate/bicarbonate transport system substrate-binding protein